MKNIYAFFYSLTMIVILCSPIEMIAQNIGIGTTTPTRAKLEVQGAVDATSAIFGGETTGISLQRNWPGIGFNEYWNGGRKYIANGYGAVQFFDPNTGSMYLDMLINGTANQLTGGVSRALVINSAGNVGIKTDATNASLYVVKGGNFEGTAVFRGSVRSSHFNYGIEENTHIRAGNDSRTVYLNDVGSHVILGGGNTMVGINSSDPTSTLEIRQYASRGLVLINPDDSFNNWEYRVALDFQDAPASSLNLYYNGDLRGYFRPTGGYNEWSDARGKTNVKVLHRMLDKINLLQPTMYAMQDHNDQHEKTFGFIAQEVKAVFPELVSVHQMTVDNVNRIPDLHGLNHKALSVIAIKALQEQYEEIKTLQREMDMLMKKLEEMEKK